LTLPTHTSASVQLRVGMLQANDCRVVNISIFETSMKVNSLRFLARCLNNNNNNNNNNKQICIAPKGRNFRGAGGRQCVSEQRKKGKPGRRGKSLAWT